MNKIISFLAVCFIFCTLMNAQNSPATPILTLEEAIRISQENSPAAKQIRASYQSNYWSFKASEASRRPQLSLQGNAPGFTRQINRVIQPDGSFIFIPVQQAFSNGNLFISQDILATGGNITVGSGISRGDIFTTQETYYQANPLLISLYQPLFRFNVRKWQWQQDKLQLQYATVAQLELLEDLSINVTQSFFNLHMARLQLQNAQLNMAINDTIYKIAKGRFSVGKIAENELLQVELSFTNARNAVEQQRLQIILSEMQLGIFTGPLSKETIVIPPERIPEIQPEIQKAIAEAKNNRSDLITYTMNEKKAERALREAQLSRRFTGDLNVNYGLNQTGPTIASSTKNLLESQYVGIGFNIPLASFGKNKAIQRSAEYALEAQRQSIQNNLNGLELDIYTAVLQLEQLRNSLIISAKADTIARKRYEVARNRYRIGTVDITNLLIAQNEKDQALLTYISTLRDYWVAYFRLRRLTLFDWEKNVKIAEATVNN